MTIPALPGLSRLLDQLADGVLLLDARGVVEFASRQALDLLGHTEESLVGTPVDALVPGPLRARHQALRQAFAADPTARPMGAGLDLHAVRADGRLVPVDIALSPLDDGRVLVCLRDLSERALLVERVRVAEARYRMLVEDASEVFYRFSYAEPILSGRVEFVSPQVQRLVGHPPEAFLADPTLWFSLVHEEDREAVAGSLDQLFDGRRELNREFRVRDALTGRWRWVADRVVPLYDPMGRPVGYQGVARDITEQVHADQERRALQERLAHGQKLELVGRLAGGVAHDFNNLLTVTLASCELGLAEAAADNPLRAELELIADTSRRAARLTRQLLAFSRRRPIQARVVDLHSHLAGLEGLLRRTIRPDTRLDLCLQSAPAWVLLDPSQLDEVVLNLAVNARDAMPQGGTLRLSTSWWRVREGEDGGPVCLAPGAYVRLDVRDTGVGIEAHVLPHVCEPYFTTKPEGQGTGLGLSSVFGVVTQSGGGLHLASTPGEGTTVSVYLPLQPGPGLPEPEGEGAPRPGAGETILLVDAHDEARVALARVLSQRGYRVLEARSIDQALGLAREHGGPIDLLFAELLLPGGTGTGLADRVEQTHPRLGRLFMSGYHAGPLPPASSLRGAPLLAKPIEPRELVAQVQAVLASRPGAPQGGLSR